MRPAKALALIGLFIILEPWLLTIIVFLFLFAIMMTTP